MPRNGRQRRQQRPQHRATPPEPKPNSIRLYGDSSGNDPVDFNATDPQNQSSFLTKLPVEIRNIIYEKVWGEAGLSQHLLPHRISPNEPRGEIRYYHAKCVTWHDNPVPDDQRGPPPDNLDYKVARRRRGNDPTFSDGTDAMWKEDCYFCKSFFDARMDPKMLPRPPVERNSPFFPMLLCCKAMYPEVFKSITNNICFQFLGDYYVKDFLQRVQLPIVYQLRHIMLLSSFAFSDARKFEWPHLMELFRGLPGLQYLTIWMDNNRRWRNNKDRYTLSNPRLCACFAQVPVHIDLKVTVPLETLTEGANSGTGIFNMMVKYTGGLIEAATMDMVIGDII